MICEFKTKEGCSASIPVKCSDDCIIRNLKKEIKALEKDIEECNKECVLVINQNKAIKKQYDELLKEISLTN